MMTSGAKLGVAVGASTANQQLTELSRINGHIEQLALQASVLVSRLASLGDRLLGGCPPEPTGPKTTAPVPVPNGAVASIGEAIDTLARNLGAVDREIGRLEAL